MGKANRERRRAKQKKTREQRRHRASNTASGAFAGGREPGRDELVLSLVGQAVHGLHQGADEPEPELVAALVENPSPGWAHAVDRILFTALEESVGHVWESGWQPAELVRAVKRELGREAGALVADAVVVENRRYAAARVADVWAAQVRDLGEPWWGEGAVQPGEFAERHGPSRQAYVGMALCVLALLAALPPLQVLLPLPGKAWARPVRQGEQADPAKLAKVRALLAKAEATEFPEEAEALTARAQQMMARHRIDHAALAAETGTESEVGGRRLPLDAPYEQHKAVLLNVVADANGCRSVWHNHLGLCTVMGQAEDVNAVEMLFTSLLVQATRAMQRAGSTRDVRGRSRTRSFRSSFLSAFAARISERLNESVHTEQDRAVHEYARAGTDLLPVLASKERQVEEAVAEAFPELGSVQLNHSNNVQGWRAGRAAADSAALHTGQRIES
ncbi:DUF2786 domain-containing protein [Nocardiopsis valliformis]|uniref:DUF2786 domain-containing protein n=1 Tax=Nocardiopsis valliformis TaxID=239974 RepID=UPI000348BF73|nr:DUF2786 domain-containing protein [Nocardiopsis valliformis]